LKIASVFHHVIYYKIEYENFIWFISLFWLVPSTKANDLAKIYDEKLCVLRKLKPEYFDSQGNLISRNNPRLHSNSQMSALSSKK